MLGNTFHDYFWIFEFVSFYIINFDLMEYIFHAILMSIKTHLNAWLRKIHHDHALQNMKMHMLFYCSLREINKDIQA
jgi:hypothetical protein